VLALQLGIFRQRTKFGLDRFDFFAAHRNTKRTVTNSKNNDGFYCPSDASPLPVLARRVASASTSCARSG
jgi:hypothetical protein